MRLAINGFGRIGRTLARINLSRATFELTAVNDINPHLGNHAYLLRYDSNYGRACKTISHNKDCLIVDDKEVTFSCVSKIDQAPWEEGDVDVLIDSSGVADNVAGARNLIERGIIKCAVITHCSKEVDREIILGVNDTEISQTDQLLSSSICDSNAIAHPLKWLNDEYGIESGSVTTLHPWLSYQNLVDGPSKSQSNPGFIWPDYALGRASIGALIPKNTTAMDPIYNLLPHLKDKFVTFSYRVPTSVVGSADISLTLSRFPGEKQIRDFIIEKCEQSRYVNCNLESRVSYDYLQEDASAYIDMQWFKCAGQMLKLILWYDNEWGYSCRALELAEMLLKTCARQ